MKGARRLLLSLNVILTLAVLGALFIMVNFIASRRYARWDLTRQRMAVLSDKTLQTLKTLKEPLTVTVFYQPTSRLYDLITDLLNEYARANPLIRVERVDPEQDIARAKQLAKEFKIEDANVVVFRSGSRQKYLADPELAEYDYASLQFGGQPRVKAFKGEEAFTSAIVSVTQAASPLAWMITGHGEKSVEDAAPAGLSDFKHYLEQHNMVVQSVTLLERTGIPAEVKMIVVPGPARRFTETELISLQAYLQQGGRLLALIDPLDDTGLDGLLAQWGIELGMDIVVDPARQLPFVSAANLFVTTYTHHPIVEKMKMLMTLFPLARSVRPTPSLPSGVAVTPLALTSDEGWGERQTGTSTFEFTEGKDLKGPVSIAVAAERPAAAEAGGQAKPTRLVVIGDSDFIINTQLSNVGNRDFLLGAVYWLAEQEQLIGIGPKALESIKLTLTAAQLTATFWFSVLTLPLACGLLGAGVWWMRRT
ncbi:MAG: GldG family protein [Candidatus Omnitrophica bacterium]|nr:GldG family protein [Candidatus Omnitrophota bacterium]